MCWLVTHRIFCVTTNDHGFALRKEWNFVAYVWFDGAHSWLCSHVDYNTTTDSNNFNRLSPCSPDRSGPQPSSILIGWIGPMCISYAIGLVLSLLVFDVRWRRNITNIIHRLYHNHPAYDDGPLSYRFENNPSCACLLDFSPIVYA